MHNVLPRLLQVENNVTHIFDIYGAEGRCRKLDSIEKGAPSYAIITMIGRKLNA